MLQALGFEMCDKDGNEISLGAVGLKDLELIGKEHVIPELRQPFSIASKIISPTPNVVVISGFNFSFGSNVIPAACAISMIAVFVSLSTIP